MRIQRIISILLILLGSCLVTMAQQQQAAEQAREAVCQRVACRPVTTVRLKLNNKEYFEMEFPRGPYFVDGFINVLAGEEVLVELDDSNGALSKPHYREDCRQTRNEQFPFTFNKWMKGLCLP